MSIEHNRGRIIKRAIKALQFIQTYPRWTAEDLADELGIEKRNAQDWIYCLQEVMPIEKYRPYRNIGTNGQIAALYGLSATPDLLKALLLAETTIKRLNLNGSANATLEVIRKAIEKTNGK